jgi:hypothetical protein
MPGIVPGIPIRWARSVPTRDGRDKPGHDVERVLPIAVILTHFVIASLAFFTTSFGVA